MYRVIAYHGKGDDGEVENDLRLLWDGLRDFVKHRRIQHVYCFQAVRDGEEADLVLVLKYRDNVARKLALSSPLQAKGWALPNSARLASQIHNHVDYWFYVRDRGQGI